MLGGSDRRIVARSDRRRLPLPVLLLGTALSTTPALAGDVPGWQLDVGLGAATGNDVVRRAPFTFDGLTFAGPYTRCRLTEIGCAPDGQHEFVMADDHHTTFVGNLVLRRRLGAAWSLGLGVQGGIARRRSLPARIDIEDGTDASSFEPETVRNAADTAERLGPANNGHAGLVYLNASLRYEHAFEQGPTVHAAGYDKGALFVEAGAGVLPAFPGDADSGDAEGSRGVHASVGGRIPREGADVIVAVTHVRVVSGTGHLASGGTSWTALSFGLAFGR